MKFVTYLNSMNQIPVSDATPALIVITAVLIILSVATFQKKKEKADHKNEFLTLETSIMLRGLAILLLLFGHFAMFSVEGEYFFEDAGTWAVTIFLLLSGIAVKKTYGFADAGKVFFLKRLRKLLPATWITLIVFYILDFALRDGTHSSTKIFLNFLGIITPNPPNSPAWFITYILYLYFLYYTVSKINLSNRGRIALLFALSYATTFVIASSPFLSNIATAGLWTQYAIVFPLSVAVGTYHGKVREWLARFFKKTRIAYFLVICVCIYIYCSGKGLYKVSHLFSSWIYTEGVLTLRPLTLIFALLMISHLTDRFGVNSKFLIWLGRHSFEIFLVHLPFMVYYDFLLFRKPLSIFFFLYLLFIFILSYLLGKTTTLIDHLFFRERKIANTI